MAEWYWLAKDTTKAIEAQLKAIERLKVKKNLSTADLAAYEIQLQHYKKR